MDKKEENEYRREWRKRTNNSSTKKYEKTPNGFLMRLYRNMKSRVHGIQKVKHHLYQGKELLNKQEFYSWAKDSKDFWKIYNAWVESDYDRKLTPSVDRKNTKIGYVTENMEWVTHSENSKRGGKYRPNQVMI